MSMHATDKLHILRRPTDLKNLHTPPTPKDPTCASASDTIELVICIMYVYTAINWRRVHQRLYIHARETLN